jgi:hypothetical protein
MLNRTFFLISYLFKVKNTMFMDAALRFGAALAEHGSVRRWQCSIGFAAGAFAPAADGGWAT